eukprot:CAMPEP_0168347640 /NCGR_PEP_ID=MMETSP0213-20121227/19147_1 /TAXON_ID=151035 /ORGANISM="Euplotes harpa, Strain FSP1.4" /LENGTH=285 /DNA_ID=CAMNT_0008356841 /DNA_START=153 /DNA_END=1011 /DNA_ORIENTATION=-
MMENKAQSNIRNKITPLREKEKSSRPTVVGKMAFRFNAKRKTPLSSNKVKKVLPAVIKGRNRVFSMDNTKKSTPHKNKNVKKVELAVAKPMHKRRGKWRDHSNKSNKSKLESTSNNKSKSHRTNEDLSVTDNTNTKTNKRYKKDSDGFATFDKKPLPFRLNENMASSSKINIKTRECINKDSSSSNISFNPKNGEIKKKESNFRPKQKESNSSVVLAAPISKMKGKKMSYFNFDPFNPNTTLVPSTIEHKKHNLDEIISSKDVGAIREQIMNTIKKNEVSKGNRG